MKEVVFLANRKPIQSREEAIRESMNSPIKLDPTITFSIPRANVQFDPKKHKYKWTTQVQNLLK